MTRIRCLWPLALLAALTVLCLWGCGMGHDRPALGSQVYTVTMAQPGAVYTTAQPATVYVAQPARVLYHQPAPVYVRQPAPVVTPVRMVMPPVSRRYHCIPGTTRSCEGPTYCGYGGIQYCNGDGMSWGPCIESRY